MNVYADELSKGFIPDPARLEFYVRQNDGSFGLVTAQLLGIGSLAPLFFAFGLISEEEALRDAVATAAERDGRDLFQWLSGVAAEAAMAADQHDAIKREIRQLRAELEDRYGFASLEIGGEFSLGGQAQRQQRDALAAFAEGMLTLEETGGIDAIVDFEGLTVKLYHPDAAPLATIGYQDAEGAFNMRSEPMESHIGETGILHIVAYPDAERVAASLSRLELNRAQLLGKVSTFWGRRSRELAVALRSLLGVENVWFDARAEDAGQKFVLWVGAILEKRDLFADTLKERTFAFSVLVHSDENSPLLDFIDSSSVLQVRNDCPPKHLLAFMASEAGEMAHETATLVADSRAEEEAALEAVKFALGAKHVVRVCSSYDQHKVVEAAARLIEAAPSIRAAVDLSGVSLAIDDCYDVWESGYISIPFDFEISDLKPKLQALLMAPTDRTETTVPVSRNGTIQALPATNLGCTTTKLDFTRRECMCPSPVARTFLGKRQHQSRLFNRVAAGASAGTILRRTTASSSSLLLMHRAMAPIFRI